MNPVNVHAASHSLSRRNRGWAILRTALMLLTGLQASATMGGVSDLDAKDVLAHVRSAIGYENLARHANGVLLRGRIGMFGEAATYSLRFDAMGRFVRRIDGRLDVASGFDGRRGWAVDWTGMPRTLELNSLSVVQTPIWVIGGHWLGDSPPFMVAVNSRFSNDKQIALDLHLKDSTLAIIMAVDRATWLPVNLCTGSSEGEDEWTFEEYRSFDGFMLPHRITHKGGGSSKAEEIQIKRVEPAADAGGDPYAPVAVLPDNTRFDPSLPPEVKLTRTTAGPYLFRPRVNGRDVGWFVLDSGATVGMVISPEVAKALDMPTYGEVSCGGFGARRVRGRFCEGESFELGRLSIERPIFVQADIGFVQAHVAEPVAGLCGYDLLARAVVELDLQSESMALFDPAVYELRGGDWEELFLEFKFPCVRARFEGPHEGLFRIDTGPGLALTAVFHKPAVGRYRLLEGRKTTFAAVQGVGGVASLRSGRLEWFELGGHRFEKPTVMFEMPGQVAVDSGYHVFGTLGLRFFEPFRVVFNYPDKKIALVARDVIE